ncbi:hypothetical protein CEXT_244411 [Caerostris extrusa]|uniref:Uncharacterized protein n=1 Tax=Caerostris extrusa TaxID=172846 RepID=A0AAV4VDM6_CAEEX|nr:hypothetical protein CEXT_244411 [Caerostris extrusa]
MREKELNCIRQSILFKVTFDSRVVSSSHGVWYLRGEFSRGVNLYAHVVRASCVLLSDGQLNIRHTRGRGGLNCIRQSVVLKVTFDSIVVSSLAHGGSLVEE